MVLVFLFFSFKQKTAYEIPGSEWSSEVCSSDLRWNSIEEFGRPLSSIEFQRIGQWLEEDHYQPEILKLDRKSVV